jgi:hypothetical protein
MAAATAINAVRFSSLAAAMCDREGGKRALAESGPLLTPKSRWTEKSEPSLQFEKSSGEEFCDDSPDEASGIGDVAEAGASGRNAVAVSSRFVQKFAGLGMLRSGGMVEVGVERKLVLSGVSGSDERSERLMARFSWRESLTLKLLLSLLLLGP